MAAQVYRTKQGDMLDWVCWHQYGRTEGVVEKVLEANPELAETLPYLPENVFILLPDIEGPTREEVVRIWS